MKHVQIASRRCEKNQIAGSQMRRQSWYRALAHASHARPQRAEPRHRSQDADDIRDRYSRYRYGPEHPFARVVPDPQRHVVISAIPADDAVAVATSSQPLDEIVGVRGARERQHGLDIGNAVEAGEGGRECLAALGGSYQRIRLIGPSEKRAGKNLDPVTD